MQPPLLVIIGADAVHIRQVGQGKQHNILQIFLLLLAAQQIPEDPGIDKDPKAAVGQLETVLDIGQLTDETGRYIVIFKITAQGPAAGGLARDLDKGHFLEIPQVGSLRKLLADAVIILPCQRLHHGPGHHKKLLLFAQLHRLIGVRRAADGADDQVHPIVGHRFLQHLR